MEFLKFKYNSLFYRGWSKGHTSIFSHPPLPTEKMAGKVFSLRSVPLQHCDDEQKPR